MIKETKIVNTITKGQNDSEKKKFNHVGGDPKKTFWILMIIISNYSQVLITHAVQKKRIITFDK